MTGQDLSAGFRRIREHKTGTGFDNHQGAAPGFLNKRYQVGAIGHRRAEIPKTAHIHRDPLTVFQIEPGVGHGQAIQMGGDIGI